MSQRNQVEAHNPSERRRRRRRVGAGAVLLMVGGASWYFWRGPAEPSLARLTIPFRSPRLAPNLTEVPVVPAAPGSLAGCNLLLITLDATRLDRLGCYGNERIETPNLDRLASEGIMFSRAVATAPTTLPSHASMMTGLYPYHHGARANGAFALGKAHRTLAEVLAEQGYTTGAVVSAFVLDARFGLDRGFDHYDDDLSDGPEPAPFMYEERMAPQTTDRALRWLRRVEAEPFFLWVHYFDPHAPYRPGSPFAERYRDNRYDGEIALVDREMGRLSALLDERGWARHTLWVIVADHGEGLQAHGEQTHGYLVYDSTLQVPLIMSCPDRLDDGRVVSRTVSQVDLMPTVLSLLGARVPANLDGQDLTQPGAADRAVFAATVSPFVTYGWAPLAAVYEGGFKYIHGPTAELYDVSDDPLETRNLAGDRPELAARMRVRLEELFGADLAAALTPSPTRHLDADERTRLEALGYVMSGTREVGVDSRHPSEPPDPKAMLPILDSVEEVLNAYLPAGRKAEAIDRLEQIGREHPDFLPTFRYLGNLYRQEGRLADAEAAFRQGLRIRPDAEELADLLLETLKQHGRTEEAIELLQDMVARDPGSFALRYSLSTMLLEEGRVDQAILGFRAAFELNPASASCLTDLRRAHARLGRDAEFRSWLELELEANPRLPVVRGALAESLSDEGRFAEAEWLLRDGYKLMPDDSEAVATLARFLVHCPDLTRRAPDEAIALLEEACKRSDYQDAMTMYRLVLVYEAAGRAADGLRVARQARLIADRAGQDKLVQAIDALQQALAPASRFRTRGDAAARDR